jgi:hypothetical protein
MTEEEKDDTIHERAVFLKSRTVEGYQFDLYQIDGFYIEKLFLIEGDFLLGIRAFETTDLLKPYLKGIRVRYLLPKNDRLNG